MKNNNYAILRVTKIKSQVAMRHASRHVMREMNVPNADPEKGGIELLAGSSDALKKFTNIMDRHNIKSKSDSVLALNYVMSFSPEMADKIDINEWKRDNLEWIAKRHGGSGMILQAVLHTDETTPHMHVMIMPITNKKPDKRIKDPVKRAADAAIKYQLNAKNFTGSAAKLRQMQDSYIKAMEHHGLERGIKGSKAINKDIQTFYAEINKNVEEVKSELENILDEDVGIFNKKRWVEKIRDKIVELAHSAKLIENKERQLNKRERAVERTKNALDSVFRRLGINNDQDIEEQLNNKIELAAQQKTLDLQQQLNNAERNLNELPKLNEKITELENSNQHLSKQIRALDRDNGLQMR